MSRDVGIRLEGARELRASLKDAGDDLADFKAAHAEAAEVVQTVAVGLVPVRTGALRASIRSTGSATAGVVRAGSARVPYAAAIHYGWPRRGIKPHPFITEAAKRETPRVVDVIEQHITRILNKIKGA